MSKLFMNVAASSSERREDDAVLSRSFTCPTFILRFTRTSNLLLSLIHILYEINAAYLQLFERVDPETGEILFTDEELDAIKEEFEVKADNIGCLIKEVKALIKARKEEIDALKMKNDSDQKRVDHLEKYLLNALMMRGKKKLATARNTISTRNTKSVSIDAEILIPKEYLKVKTETSPMKKEIGAALKQGIDVPGCSLVEKTSLTVK